MARFTYLKRTPVIHYVYCSVCNSVCAKMQGKQWQEYGKKKKVLRLDENLYENPLHTKITLLYIRHVKNWKKFQSLRTSSERRCG